MESISELHEIFKYEYVGGGYFRKRGVPKKTTAPILHGEQAITHLYNAMVKMYKEKK